MVLKYENILLHYTVYKKNHASSAQNHGYFGGWMPKALRQHKRNELELGWCERFFQRGSCLESVLKIFFGFIGIVYAICDNLKGLWCININQCPCKKNKREKSEDEKSAEPFLLVSNSVVSNKVTVTENTNKCENRINVSRCQKLWGEIRETNLNFFQLILVLGFAILGIVNGILVLTIAGWLSDSMIVKEIRQLVANPKFKDPYGLDLEDLLRAIQYLILFGWTVFLASIFGFLGMFIQICRLTSEDPDFSCSYFS